MPSVVVVADDLTGAADTGVTFAQLGMATRVVWDVIRVPQAEVLVISTETRESDRSDAAARLRRVAHVLATDQEIAHSRLGYAAAGLGVPLLRDTDPELVATCREAVAALKTACAEDH